MFPLLCSVFFPVYYYSWHSQWRTTAVCVSSVLLLHSLCVVLVCSFWQQLGSMLYDLSWITVLLCFFFFISHNYINT